MKTKATSPAKTGVLIRVIRGAQKVLFVPDEIVKLSYPVDEKVIDSCLELLAAGRPLSEIMSEARRLAAVSQQHPASLHLKIVENAKPTAEITAMPFTAAPEHARSKFLMPMIIAGAALLGGLGGTAATAYLTRTAPVTATAHTATPTPESSLSIALSPTANAEPQPPAVAAVAADEIKSTDIKALIERGSRFVGSGDLGTARRLYARAAEAGDPQAAIYLGETYDPAFLKRARFGRSARGHLDSAVYWYRRARDLGSTEAEEMLKRVIKSSAD
jgi:TPR repeat protein